MLAGLCSHERVVARLASVDGRRALRQKVIWVRVGNQSHPPFGWAGRRSRENWEQCCNGSHSCDPLMHSAGVRCPADDVHSSFSRGTLVAFDGTMPADHSAAQKGRAGGRAWASGSRRQPTGGDRLNQAGRLAATGKREERAGAESRVREGGSKAAVLAGDAGTNTSGGTGGYASPPAQLVWKGYEWALGLQDHPVFCNKETAAAQQKIMGRQSKGHDSCLYLTLCAFHVAQCKQSEEWLLGREWGQAKLGAVEALIGEFCKVARIRVILNLLGSQGELLPQLTLGWRGPTRQVLLVPGGGDGLHLLPLGPPSGRSVTVPVLIHQDIIGSGVTQEPAAAAPAMVDVASSSPPAMPAKVPDAPQPAPAGEAKPDAVAPVPPAAQVPPAPAGPPPPVPGGSQVLSWDECEGGQRLTYVGIQPPPKGIAADWLGGWFPGQCPREPSLVLGAISMLLTTPDLASATLDNFVRYGPSVEYVDVRFENGLQQALRRTVTDGATTAEFFTAGDTIQVRQDSWVVKRVSVDRLQVVPVGLAAAYTRSWTWMSWSRGSAKIHPCAAQLSQESLSKAVWSVAVLESTDPVQTSVLTRMRADEAASGYKGADAESSADLVRVVVKQYRKVGNVSGPYGWGYCYSCGGGLGNRAKQRICEKCNHRNTQLGRMIAEGCKVTSTACPVMYPGVVWTKSRHPGLKKGVRTVATGKVFHTPRRT
jgi:hypothetical protein